MIRTISETLVAVGDSTELMLLVKATFAVILGLSIAWVARTARASLRHLVFIATFGVLLALPLAIAFVPQVRFQIQSSQRIASAPVSTRSQDQVPGTLQGTDRVGPAATANTTSVSPRLFLQVAWGLGMALFLVPFVNGLWKLSRIRRSGLPWRDADSLLRTLAESAGIRRRIDVLLHDDLAVPVTCGVFRPAILLPADASSWSELDRRRVLVHELEHIKRFDWMAHLLTRVICAVYWFHPLVWVAWRQMSLEAERACDDAVVVQTERADYAEQLVALARRLTSALAPPVLSMANRSDLSTRVSAILDRNQSRGRAGVVFTSATLAVALAVVVGIAPIRAVSSPAPQQQQVQKSTLTVSLQQKLNRALLEASESNEIDDMIKLLASGADVNATVEGDGSPLIAAAGANHIAAVKLLLDRGADPNMGVEGDGNPIIAAAGAGHEDVVKLLLDAGANVNLVVPGDENALIQASGSGHFNVVQLLVSRGADVNARVWSERASSRTGEWRTPLNMARKAGHTSVVDFLISHGARE